MHCSKRQIITIQYKLQINNNSTISYLRIQQNVFRFQISVQNKSEKFWVLTNVLIHNFKKE